MCVEGARPAPRPDARTQVDAKHLCSQVAASGYHPMQLQLPTRGEETTVVAHIVVPDSRAAPCPVIH